MAGKPIRPTSVKNPDPNKPWWSKNPGLPGEAIAEQRRCPVCGQAYYRTRCPNSRCLVDGEAPETRPLAARAPRAVEEVPSGVPLTGIGASSVDSPLNHLALANKSAPRTRAVSKLPLSKRESMPAAATSHKRYSMNRME